MPKTNIPQKRICVKGHDTILVGRNSSGVCKICAKTFHKHWYTKMKQFCKNGHDRTLKQTTANGWCRKCSICSIRKYQYKKRYGISLVEYNNLFMSQNGCCKICGIHQTADSRKFAVDHNHKTGQIRGLLCASCNSGLGYFKDNTTILENAITYIKQTSRIS